MMPVRAPARRRKCPAKAGWRSSSAPGRRPGCRNIGLIAAGIAFYMFAAIVPSLGAVVLSYGLFADAETVRGNVEAIFAAVPREAATIVTEQLLAVIQSAEDKQGLGLVVALAVASGATKGATAIATGLNVTYDTHDAGIPAHHRSAAWRSWPAASFSFSLRCR
ncbi:YhjD/YihY/BrkB family envelope integrity protein [Sphingomonas sp. MMS24-JH45]